MRLRRRHCRLLPGLLVLLAAGAAFAADYEAPPHFVPADALPADKVRGARWLERAVESMPSNARARYNLGLLLSQLEPVDEARAALEKGLALAPADFDLLFALADLELRNGYPQEALSLADRMIAARPEDPTGRQVRATAERLLLAAPGPASLSAGERAAARARRTIRSASCSSTSTPPARAAAG